MTGPQDGESPRHRPAGPVAGEDTSSSQAAGEEPSPTPPAGDSSAGDAQGQAAAGSPGAVQNLEADFEQLLADTQRKRDEYLDLAKRTKADFENFRKRMVAETKAAGARGKADVIREVVPVLDDLERALQAAGLDPDGDSPDALAHGVLLVFRSLREALERNGVEPVDPGGEPFDPQLHEALSTQPAPDADSGTVVEVVQKGYRLGDQLLRPARVVVAE
jgi:molecular chaperone GrpE